MPETPSSSRQPAAKGAPKLSRSRALVPVPEKPSTPGEKLAQATARASEAVVQSIRQEEPKTLAKIALAAVTPQLVGGLFRFALRNPATMLACVTILAVAWTVNERNAAEAAKPGLVPGYGA